MKTLLPLALVFVLSLTARAEFHRSPSGDLIIRGVPMIDQGDRAYCVTASLARLLLYYNIPADQTALATLARTDPTGGIDLTRLLPTLRPYLARRGVQIKTLYAWTPESFAALMRRYNTAARHTGAPPVSLRSKNLNVPALLRQTDHSVLRQVRLEEHRASQNFLADIAIEINAGRPLLWAVQQSLAPHATPRAADGHMRLIIGFNPATRELLYTDPWGPGHELSRMSYDNAWSMTTALLKLTPQQSEKALR